MIAGAIISIVAATGAPIGQLAAQKFVVPDTLSALRGTVTDSAGHPLDSIEVFVMTSGQTTRTDRNGRYFFPNLLDGHTRVRARRVGWTPVDTAFTLPRHVAFTVNLTLRTRLATLDTIRVTSSQDDCAPRLYSGFACRRRAAVGVFRDSAELAALKPDWDADLFDGIPGLRRDGHGVLAVTHWRCISRLVNGRPPTPIERIDARRLGYVKDIVAIEFYADANDAPKWYKVFTWPPSSSVPCSLIIYWTKGPK
jgi:hypothetical protein